MPSERLSKFSTYAFAEVDKAIEEAKKAGYKIIDLGVGDPTDPLYEGAVEGLKAAAEKHSRSGYPSYTGMREFREAAAGWLQRRFSVNADTETQITATAGSKEAIFHLPFALINPGDHVLMPSIGYPPYKSGTVFAGGAPVFYSLSEENNFLPDLNEIENILESDKKIKLMWINYPNNPTTVIAGKKVLGQIVEISNKHDVVVASDEAYSEMYVRDKPRSILEFSDDWRNLIVFQSLSKRSNATSLRAGFAVGGENLILHFRNFRMQMDSGIPNLIQEASIAAWKDEEHVEQMRKTYNERRNVMVSALRDVGIKCWAEATFYIWAKVFDSMDFSKKLLALDRENKTGISVMPGKYLSLDTKENANSYVRFALVSSLRETEMAADLLRKHLAD